VAFYVDSNGDGVLDAGDALLGYGMQSAGAWIYSFTVNLPSGTYTLFAQAEDNDGALDDPFAHAPGAVGAGVEGKTRGELQ
jgi:hypothetical protein